MPIIPVDIDIKIKEDIDYLNQLYNYFTNAEFISKQSPSTSTLDTFKVKLHDFKKNYGSMSNYEFELKKFDDLITQGENRNGRLKLFDEPLTTFNETVSIKKYEELAILTDITMMIPNSLSSSYIFRAKYSGKQCYIKAFFNNSIGVLYEQKIYRYIGNRNKCIEPYFKDYFVEVYDTFKTTSYDFKRILEEHKVKIQGTTNLWSNNSKFKKDSFDNIYINLIITQDTGGITYHEFYQNNYKNENLITNTIFDIVYGLYLMNDKLKIMHNDNHFGNILIKTNLAPTESKHQIGKIEYTKTKNFSLCFYDFDLSYLQNEKNPYIETYYITVPNKRSAKDIWTLLNSLVYSIYYFNPPVQDTELNFFFNSIFMDVEENDTNKSYIYLKYINNIVYTIL
jgi:hypothetical protein